MTAQLQIGQLIFRPGQSLPTISSDRPSLAGILLRGKPAQSAPQQLARLYSLCGESHRITAQLAIDAAAGLRTQATSQERLKLMAETMREHVRRIWLDWPRLFAQPDQNMTIAALQSLRDCPLLMEHNVDNLLAASSRFRQWIESAVLGESAPEWLTAWQTNPIECMLDWVARAHTFPAKLLRDIEYDAVQIQTSATPFVPHSKIEILHALARRIETVEDFERAPSNADMVCETGIWTRLDGFGEIRSLGNNLWLRMGARIAELVLLSEWQQAQNRLALGSLTLAPGLALAWCEMARGLLLHWVRLEHTGATQCITDYRVVAPTEWNFHPSGVVAHALAAMPIARDAIAQAQVTRQVNILAAAFDPCVNYKIEFEHA